MDKRRVGYISVGVDRTSGAFVDLKGAAAGAQAFASWLDGQQSHGVEVFGTVLSDADDKSVSARDVQDATATLVDAGGLDLLVLFFSGHGIVKSGNDEQVLLSDVLRYPDEAISIAQTLTNARTVGVPHVIVISDACRNAIDPYSKLGQVSGKPALQSVGLRGVQKGKVDVFYATEASQTAREYNGEGFFTKILLETLTKTPARVRENWPGFSAPVIPAWRLEEYLAEEIPRRAYKATPSFDQTPDFIITSRAPLFLGLATIVPPKDKVFSSRAGAAYSMDMARDSAPQWDITNQQPIKVPEPKPKKVPSRRKALKMVIDEISKWDFDGLPENLLEMSGLNQFYDSRLEESYDDLLPGVTSGYVIVGAKVDKVLCANPNINLVIENNAENCVISFQGSKFDISGSSVIVFLENTTMFALPIMPDYLGRVDVNGGLVNSISFELNWAARSRLAENQNTAKFFRIRRAVAAALTAAGQIQRLGNVDAGALALILREDKRVDPTLGIYASYAYSMADNEDAMRSIFDYFRRYHAEPIILKVGAPIPFDVAMLGGAFRNSAEPNFSVGPFCPMMSLGWSFLDAYTDYGVINEIVLKAGRQRLNSEWTTFSTSNSKALIKIYEKGEIK